LKKLEQLRTNFDKSDVEFLLMNSNPKVNTAALRERSTKGALAFPVLLDHAQLVSESLGVATSAVAVILDPDGGKLLYRGPVGPEAEASLRTKVSGSGGPTLLAPTNGCAIASSSVAKRAKRTPDYVKDVAPVIEKNCAVCHHEGGIGPFAMNSYAMVKGWSPMIREVLLTKRMPPMQVDPAIRHFSNARYIADADLQTLVHWIDAGSPRGSSSEDPLTKLSFGGNDQWQLGQPDYIVRARTHDIPSAGVIDYINDEVELSFNEDKWVRAVQFIPGAPTVLHHLLTYVTGPNDQFAGGEATNSTVATRFLEGYAPGKVDAMVFPTDTGVHIPKGHKLTMQFHYTTNGKPASDSTILGLYFHDKPPKYEYLNRAVSGPVNIPANAREVKTRGVFVFPEDVVVYGLRAHMHFRGRDMKFSAETPDGQHLELLSVPNYSYAWQPTYQLVEPVALKAGTKVYVTGSFDNSKYNMANPDPNKSIRFGLQSWDEMFIGYWSYTAQKPSN
jgi:hypothetical protein